jgi:hypothetical protein
MPDYENTDFYRFSTCLSPSGVSSEIIFVEEIKKENQDIKKLEDNLLLLRENLKPLLDRIPKLTQELTAKNLTPKLVQSKKTRLDTMNTLVSMYKQKESSIMRLLGKHHGRLMWLNAQNNAPKVIVGYIPAGGEVKFISN